MKERQPRRMCTFSALLRLADWMKTNWKLIEQEQFTCEQITQRVNRELNLNIGKTTTARIAKELGLILPKDHRASVPKLSWNRQRFIANQLLACMTILDRFLKKTLSAREISELTEGVSEIRLDKLYCLAKAKPEEKDDSQE